MKIVNFWVFMSIVRKSFDFNCALCSCNTPIWRPCFPTSSSFSNSDGVNLSLRSNNLLFLIANVGWPVQKAKLIWVRLVFVFVFIFLFLRFYDKKWKLKKIWKHETESSSLWTCTISIGSKTVTIIHLPPPEIDNLKLQGPSMPAELSTKMRLSVLYYQTSTFAKISTSE